MPDWLLVLTLIIVGFVLLLVELLIIPGFGFLGIAGLLLLATASYLAYSRLSLFVGIVTSGGSLVVIILACKVFFQTEFWRRLRLEKAETKEEGFESSIDELQKLVGKAGVSITPLRPSGTALIDGNRIDVLAEGGIFLPSDSEIKVVKVEGNKVIVRKTERGK